MIHRFTIPRYVGWFVALATICIGGTFALWAVHVWTPVQRHYLWAYVWCSRPGADPSSLVTIRWFYKTAPDRQAELASEDEVISSEANGPSLALSPAARQAGWTDVMLGPKEQFPAAALEPFLSEQFSDGNNAWLVVSPPLPCGLVLFCFFAIVCRMAGELVALCALETGTNSLVQSNDLPVPKVVGNCRKVLHPHDGIGSA
jgi:hypothetical protein